MQAYNTKEVSTCTEGFRTLVELKVIMPKMPKGPSHRLSCLIFIAQPKPE
jgi:large subunit ribosomal protein L29e